MKLPVKMTINGQTYSHEVEPRLLLVHYIRETVGLTGTHVGCDTSQCGACTILMNGQAVKSCTLFAVQADGAKIMTIEGLAKNGELHPIQQGFWEKHGLQCGFCTPGMIMAAHQMLERYPKPVRGADPPPARGQPLPVHRLPQHREGDPVGGREDGRRRSEVAVMAATIERVLGKSIKRREDPRFITGKGNYVDDVKLPGTTYAAFVRSPHAHARIKQHRHGGAAKQHPGRGRGLHRRGHDGRQLAAVRLDSGSRASEGSPSRTCRWPATRRATWAIRWRSSSPRAQDAAHDAAEKVQVDWEALPVGDAPPSRPRPRRSPQIHDGGARQHRLQVGARRRRRDRRRLPGRCDRGEEAHRQPAAGRQRHGAARLRWRATTTPPAS